MFIQVIQGKVTDEPRLRRCMERWERDLMPGAEGYLGTTAGKSDDGTFVVLARFESREAAMRNSARPEQGEWWQETEACFSGGVSFIDCNDVHTWLAGGSDERNMISVPQVDHDDSDAPQYVSRAQLVRIVKPRIEEILEMVRDRLAASPFAATGNRWYWATSNGGIS